MLRSGANKLIKAYIDCKKTGEMQSVEIVNETYSLYHNDSGTTMIISHKYFNHILTRLKLNISSFEYTDQMMEFMGFGGEELQIAIEPWYIHKRD